MRFAVANYEEYAGRLYVRIGVSSAAVAAM